MAAKMILAFVTMWAGTQNLSVDGCPGFNRVEVTPEDLEILGMDTMVKAHRFDNVDRVTVDCPEWTETWTRVSIPLPGWTMDRKER
jgi:hypothetical protein